PPGETGGRAWAGGPAPSRFHPHRRAAVDVEGADQLLQHRRNRADVVGRVPGHRGDRTRAVVGVGRYGGEAEVGGVQQVLDERLLVLLSRGGQVRLQAGGQAAAAAPAAVLAASEAGADRSEQGAVLLLGRNQPT